MIYTNGDYLTPALIEELAQAGLRYMHCTVSFPSNDPKQLESVKRAWERFVRDARLP